MKNSKSQFDRYWEVLRIPKNIFGNFSLFFEQILTLANFGHALEILC